MNYVIQQTCVFGAVCLLSMSQRNETGQYYLWYTCELLWNDFVLRFYDSTVERCRFNLEGLQHTAIKLTYVTVQDRHGALKIWCPIPSSDLSVLSVLTWPNFINHPPVITFL